MRLLISKTLTVTAARRFADAYPPDKYPDDTKWGKTRVALIASDPEQITAAEVADIIGNRTWSYFTCDECSLSVERAVEVGADYHTDHKMTLCPSCARAVAALASVVLP